MGRCAVNHPYESMIIILVNRPCELSLSLATPISRNDQRPYNFLSVSIPCAMSLTGGVTNQILRDFDSKVKTSPEVLKFIVAKVFIAVDGASFTVVKVFDEEECFNFMVVVGNQRL
ncbi:hypothetical protein L6452_21786 [Arctium lappa]|uniref:Uncharacterized protein n=1 Tax=Arctium lappa TaxID=4217 RepID=A0ACB9AYN2_ARCLA|nr:hypothetical protein L6452_21786 [Arctium lappa]